MRDNRRVFRTIQQAIVQLYPGEPKGITARMLTTLAAMVSEIVLGKSCQLPPTASMPPTSLSGPAGLPQLAPARNPFQSSRYLLMYWSLTSIRLVRNLFAGGRMELGTRSGPKTESQYPAPTQPGADGDLSHPKHFFQRGRIHALC
jgi:hypothetical protein